MKISILLPYKENYSPAYAGAVSLFVNSVSRESVYKKETLPVLNHYKNQNKYYPIDGHGTIENIFNSICSKIDH